MQTNSRISKWLRRAAVLAPPIVLSACALPYATPVFDSSTSQPAEKIAFRGVIDELSDSAPLDVLLVHGMCTHDGRWASNAARSLYDKIGGGFDVVSLVRTPVPDTDIELFQQTLSTRFGALRVNAIVWSGMTAPLKQQLCYDQTSRSDPKENSNAYCLSPEQTKPYPYERSASLNRMLKDVILDDCLSDALAYQGRSRDEMSARMQKAILQALAMSGNSPAAGPDMRTTASTLEGATSPLIVIADSLGSKVAFDALWRMRVEPATSRAIERTLQRTTQVFMRANQLPILALADQQIERKQTHEFAEIRAGTSSMSMPRSSQVGYPADPLGELFAPRKNAIASVPPSIVAFTDPNDLLSYVLVPSPNRNSLGYSVIDVVTSNATSYLGLVERPDSAHKNYDINPAVLQLVACGKPKSKRCR